MVIKVFLVLFLAVLATATKETSAGMERRLLSNETKDTESGSGGLLRSRRFLSRTRENCDDTSNGHCDSFNDCCDEYHDYKYWCGNYDTRYFKSNTMCCACGGGKLKGEDKIDVHGYGSNYRYLGEGQCMDEDGTYPLKFSRVGISRESCENLCNGFSWCFAYQFEFRWAPYLDCSLVTDYDTFKRYHGGFKSTSWAAKTRIHGYMYTTYCNGNGHRCEHTVYGRGSLNSRRGFACYQKISN